MTVGLTISQGANDNEALALKSSDVGHVFTSHAEVDTFFTIRKCNGDSGGAELTGYKDLDDTAENAIKIVGRLGEDAVTTKATSSQGVVNISGAGYDGSTGVKTVGTNGNIMVIRDNTTTRFIFDAEGDSHQDVGTAWTNFDDKDDALLSRSLGIVMDTGSAIQNKWDDWGRDHKEDLIQAKIIPRLTAKEEADGDHALVNTSQVMRLHNGAIWQLHCHQQSLKEVVDYQQEEIESLKKELRLLKG